jgi:hypothetical protein
VAELTFQPTSFEGVEDLAGHELLAVAAGDLEESDGAAPAILSAVASDGLRRIADVDSDDSVTFRFSEPVAALAIDASNVDLLLPLAQGHSWLDGSGALGGAAWAEGDTLLVVALLDSAPIADMDVVALTDGFQDAAGLRAPTSVLLSGTFTSAAPAIYAISPDIVRTGVSVTLEGALFCPIPSDNSVSFGGLSATVEAGTAEVLTVTVPFLVESGELVVETGGLESNHVPYGLAPIMASVSSTGSQANSTSERPALNADGRFVAFESDATNLGPGDTAGRDVFVFDRLTGETVAANLDLTGDLAPPVGARNPSLSADGRLAAFDSWSAALVSGDSNNKRDVFLRDLDGQTTIRLGVDALGLEGCGTRSEIPPSDRSAMPPSDRCGGRKLTPRDGGFVPHLRLAFVVRTETA